MPENTPVTGTVAAGTAETLLATTAPVGGSIGPQNVNDPLAPGVIPQVLVRFSYFFTWGATTTTLTLRLRRNGIGGPTVTGAPAKQGPASANPDFVHWEWYDTNVPVGTVYAITAQAAVAGVTGGTFIGSTNDFT